MMEELQIRADLLGTTVKQLAPEGLDWIVIVWDGAGEVASSSSVPHEQLVEVLHQLRREPAPVDERIHAAELGRALESPLADLPRVSRELQEHYGDGCVREILADELEENETELDSEGDSEAITDLPPWPCPQCGAPLQLVTTTGGNADACQWHACGCGWASPPESCAAEEV